MIILDTPTNVGTVTSCPHVSVIKVGHIIIDEFTGGTKCGAPMYITTINYFNLRKTNLSYRKQFDDCC